MMNKALSTLNKQTKKTFLFITVASFRNSETSSHNQDIVQGDESCNIYLILFFFISSQLFSLLLVNCRPSNVIKPQNLQ